MKSFNLFLADLNDGQTHAGLTGDLAELLQQVRNTGRSGALTIPREFQLGLRILKNGGGYKLRARLKYRLGGGAVKFWYELDRPERAVEDAFNGYINLMAEQTGYTVLLGKA